jgi:NAD(P)-dependent dehydrogenase (short-subunit alcohol dehydrogenase family)
MRKIIIVGATGTIGKAVADLLAKDHKIIRVGNRQGDYTVDLRSKASIKNLFHKIGRVDGIICTAGMTRFGKLAEVSDNDLLMSMNCKLIGQINLVRLALHYLNPKGFITLTAGMLGREPWPSTIPAAIVNAALEGFVRAAALDVDKRIRINAVNPIFVNITAKKMGLTTNGTMSAPETAKAYLASLEGKMTGQILDVRKYGIVAGSTNEVVDWWNVKSVA